MIRILLLVLSTAFWPINSLIAALKVTGAVSDASSRSEILPSRLEINEFATSGPAFDLFILALQRFQSINQTDQNSYFQIAGIHGFPAIPWDGVEGQGSYPGYCMHFSMLFPLWHRPYLALFEQMITMHAQTIANAYPPEQRARYKAAAPRIRIPYWDWAVHPTLPAVATNPKIFINGPSGWYEIRNPLYRYEFHSGPEGNGLPTSHQLANTPYTVRNPSAALNSSDNAAASQAMQQNAPSMLLSVYQLLSSETNYSIFSNAGPPQHMSSANNIEQIHNTVHRIVGGDGSQFHGSMWHVEVAAFDPIFWLHHAQVDRLVALWQALNPQAYITPLINHIGSFYQPAGLTDTIDTALAPFHSDSGSTMFTASDVRDIAIFGYTYPELASIKAKTNDQQAALRSLINKVYNPSIVVGNGMKERARIKRATSVADAFGHVTVRTVHDLEVNNLGMQWSIRIEAPTSDSTSLSMYFFIGEPPENISTWPKAVNLVGMYSQLGTISWPQSQHQNRSIVLARGEVLITHAVAAGVARGYLSDMTPHEVIPVLQQNLRIRVKSHNNSQISVADIPGLVVMIQGRRVEPSKDLEEFPQYGRYRAYLDLDTDKTVDGTTSWRVL